MSAPQEPRAESIAIAKLVVDQDVQRGLDTTRVGRMVKDYRPDALGAIVVSRRDDGTYHVIDGQHRVAATVAAGYGDRDMTALVYYGLTLADEAAMFRRLNNTRVVNPIDKFRVRVVEGDPAIVALNDALNRNGWTVAQSKHAGAFSAVTALEGVLRGRAVDNFDSLRACDHLIEVITAAWGHDAAGMRAEIVSGIGAVFLRHGDRIDRVKLAHELGQYPGGPLRLVGAAKGLRSWRGGTVRDAMAEVIVELLNKKRTTNRLPNWHGSED